MEGPLFRTIIFSVLIGGCAERPASQVDAVLQALQAARIAGAEDYAVEQLDEAKASYSLAINELDNQDERFLWWRTYSRAEQILNLARLQAEHAKSEAMANLEETQKNAQTAVSLARNQIQQTRALLGQPLSRLSIKLQIQDFDYALIQAETMLDIIETTMPTSRDYIQVMTTAHSVETMASSIRQHILSTITHPQKVQI